MSPVGYRFFTASDDKTARVWEAATGKELARLVGHDGGVESAAWSPLAVGADGATLILTASADGTARLWRVFASTQDLVNTAKDHMRRCLTPAQRKQYFLPEAPPFWCVERRLWPYQAWLAARKAGRDAPLSNESRR
jgi:WD40 repeat protein